MTYEVAVGGTVRTVSVQRKGQLVYVDIDGRPYVVDARRVGDTMLSMLVHGGNGSLPVRSVDATFALQESPGDLEVHVGGRTIPVQVRQPGAFGRSRAEVQSSGTGPQRVSAPMPGRVARVLVKTGDAVKARQGLVVVEAMKMENELRSARDGHVRDVSVVEGQSVDAGAVLVVVE